MNPNDRGNTRERLLNAGLELLREESVDVSVSHLKASRVARRANLTSGAFFHYWETQDVFVKDLLERGLSDERIHTFEIVRSVLQPLLEGDDHSIAERDAMIFQACQRALEHVSQSPAVAVQMALWARHLHDLDTRSQLKRVHEQFDAQFAPLYGSLLANWGLEPREPFTLARIAAVIAALGLGLAIRRAVDPQALPDEHEVFGRLVVALLPAMTREAASPPAVASNADRDSVRGVEMR